MGEVIDEKRIKDLEERDDLTLITIDYEVELLKRDFGIDDPDINGFFVKLGEDGGYIEELWGFSGTVPHHGKPVYQYDIEHEPKKKMKRAPESESVDPEINKTEGTEKALHEVDKEVLTQMIAMILSDDDRGRNWDEILNLMQTNFEAAGVEYTEADIREALDALIRWGMVRAEMTDDGELYMIVSGPRTGSITGDEFISGNWARVTGFGEHSGGHEIGSVGKQEKKPTDEQIKAVIDYIGGAEAEYFEMMHALGGMQYAPVVKWLLDNAFIDYTIKVKDNFGNMGRFYFVIGDPFK
jgi:hypothetical protein